MKKIVAISLIIFAVAVLIFLAVGLYSGQNKNTLSSNASANNSNISTSNTNNATTTPTSSKTYTTSEVAAHNTAKDCWLIIDNKVYNITSYFGQHPGGNETMTPYCGKEATKAFETKDKTRAQNHSDRAWSMLDSYFVGELSTK